MGKSVAELEEIVKPFKALAMCMSAAVGKGHVGGAMSSAEWMIGGWFDKLNIDPDSDDRDRFFVGQGHITPGIYSLLVHKGFYEWRDVVSYRRYGSPFQGHPDFQKLKGWEMSSGSLGQALGVAVGCAIAAKIRNQKHWIVTLNSDGELMEGSMWEAIMYAGAHGLDNLVTFFDFNRIQNYNRIEQTNELEPLGDKLRSFGWDVIELKDGNDMKAVLDAYDAAMVPGKGKPTAVIGHTKIGKGVSFMHDQVAYHSKSPPRDHLAGAFEELGVEFPHEEYMELADAHLAKITKEVDDSLPKYGNKNYAWNASDDMKVEMVWSGTGITEGYRQCLDNDPNVIVVTDDSHKLIGLTDDDRDHYTKTKQYIDVGCAEQNMAMVSAGLAKEGFTPLTQGYTCFSMGRAYDHIRTSIAFTNFNVKYFPTEGLLGGDGAMHESLEGITLSYYMPHMQVNWPCDNEEAKKATVKVISDVKGPVATLQDRAPKPVVTSASTAYEYGIANIIRYTGEKANFVDAFEHTLSTDWKPQSADLTIFAVGSVVSEAMRTAYILKEEKGLDVTVVNVHTIKPLDKAGIVKAVQGVGAVMTIAQQQTGGFGNIIAGAILEAGIPLTKFKMLGCDNVFGESAKDRDLNHKHGLLAEQVAETALNLIG